MIQELLLDSHLLAVDCPGGLLVQPSGTGLDSLEARAKAWLKARFAKPGAVFLEAVHRIDRPVCGVVLFARTGKALSRLNASARRREIRRVYRAWVEGRMPRDEGVLEDRLAHGDHRARACAPGDPEGRDCVLRYRTLERGGGFSLLEVVLETGRYHQIRCQLALAGHPVAGDDRYGSSRPYRPGCIALQHYSMSFPHPVGGEVVAVTSRLRLECPAESARSRAGGGVPGRTTIIPLRAPGRGGGNWKDRIGT